MYVNAIGTPSPDSAFSPSPPSASAALSLALDEKLYRKPQLKTRFFRLFAFGMVCVAAGLLYLFESNIIPLRKSPNPVPPSNISETWIGGLSEQFFVFVSDNSSVNAELLADRISNLTLFSKFINVSHS